MQAGRPQNWARPFNPNPAPHEAYGTHRGSMECLNISNRQPGYHYLYGHRDPRHAGYLHKMARYGAVPVKDGDPERHGAALPESFGLPQDSLMGTGNVFLMRMPIERYRAYLNEEAALREASVRRPTEQLMGQEQQMAGQYKRPPRGGVFFADRDHGQTGFATETKSVKE